MCFLFWPASAPAATSYPQEAPPFPRPQPTSWVSTLSRSSLHPAGLSRPPLSPRALPVDRIPFHNALLLILQKVFFPFGCSLRVEASANTHSWFCPRAAKSRSFSLTLCGFLIPCEFSVLYLQIFFALSYFFLLHNLPLSASHRPHEEASELVLAHHLCPATAIIHMTFHHPQAKRLLLRRSKRENSV